MAPTLLRFVESVPPFYKNGYVFACSRTRRAILVDPGDEIDALLTTIAREGLTVASVLLTHAHLDHITGVGAARAALGVPVYLHEADQPLYEAVVQQGLMFGLQVTSQPPVDSFYSPDLKLVFGDWAVRVHHTPGHSPGGVCLELFAERGETVLVPGDTLFAGSIGRTDLPGGDYPTLIRSIRTVLFAFPDETPVHPGHNQPTTIGRERSTNPFLLD
jgi:hydroxyacylglutathione hydrolase